MSDNYCRIHELDYGETCPGCADGYPPLNQLTKRDEEEIRQRVRRQTAPGSPGYLRRDG